jgi:putative ABC transport system substrate-binding protein
MTHRDIGQLETSRCSSAVLSFVRSAGGTWEVKRREFITLLAGAAAAWPLTARAQQSTVPVIGFLGAGSAGGSPHTVRIIRESLTAAGFIEGRNVSVDYRWAEGQYDQLPAMAADLVRRQVAVIITIPGPAARAAKAATATIPIVFMIDDDPVKLGLVESLARPGGNATGVNFFIAELGGKQLGLVRELVPQAARIGLLVNPNNANAESVIGNVTAAASGVEIKVVQARDSREIEVAFAALARDRVDALLVGADPFFYSRRVQLATHATRHAIPAVYSVRECADVGGLMSYGTSLTEVHRQIGAYVGRILKGAKPADLPVVQSIKFELVINLATARALGLEVPATLLARADEVIE